MDLAQLPDDPAVLKALLVEQLRALQDRIAALEEQLKKAQDAHAHENLRRQLVQESNAKLAFELECLKKRLFGLKTERFTGDDSQMMLWREQGEATPADEGASTDNTEDTAPDSPTPQGSDDKAKAKGKGKDKRRKRDSRGRNPIPDHLLKDRVERAVPDDERVCDICQGELSTIGYATSHRLEWVPGHFVNLEIAREKCACPDHPEIGVITAPVPAFAVPKGLPGNRLVAKVVVDKYADHIPLNRQVRRLRRTGVSIAKSTMCGWVQAVGDYATVLVQAMLKRMLHSPWIQSDATGILVLEGSKNAPHRGHFYTWSDGEEVVLTYARQGSGDHPKQVLEGFTGTLLIDGGSSYHPVCSNEGIERAGCWAHARRKFFEARKHHPEQAAYALEEIREIFVVERALRDLGPEERARQRQEILGPRLAAFHIWCQQHSQKLRPKSPLAQACRYTLNQWKTLQVFLLRGMIPAHNNASELQLRQPVIGRKNWLFAGSAGGARVAATLYSLIGSCMLQAIDPFAYLRDILPQLPTCPPAKVLELSPSAWRARQV